MLQCHLLYGVHISFFYVDKCGHTYLLYNFFNSLLIEHCNRIELWTACKSAGVTIVKEKDELFCRAITHKCPQFEALITLRFAYEVSLLSFSKFTQ